MKYDFGTVFNAESETIKIVLNDVQNDELLLILDLMCYGGVGRACCLRWFYVVSVPRTTPKLRRQ